MSGLLILPKWLIIDARQKPREGWGVRVEGGKISDVAAHEDLRSRYSGDGVFEAPGQILSPGFVNTHTHIYGVLAHGLPLENAPSGFWPFLEEFWWPKVENKLTHEMICVATDLRCADMLSSGVTTFYDCTEAPYALPGVLLAQKNSVLKSGIRGILSFEATERISSQNGKQGLRENANFVSECCEEGGLISGLMCVHTTFTCSPDFIKKAYDMACDLDVSLHLHVSEGMYEPEFTMRKYGMKPFHFYDSIGVAGPRLLASQCVHLDEDEKEIIAEKGVRVSHQPLSNCEVGGGIAPIPDLHKLGVTMGLGSDGYIDDFFEVMRGAFLIHKAYHQDPRVMSAPYVWYLATEGGARALGFEKLGRIEPGWSADLQLIDGNLPTPINKENLYEQLVLYRSAGDVKMVMVGGRIRVQESSILDIDYAAFQEKTRTEAEKLWSHAQE